MRDSNALVGQLGEWRVGGVNAGTNDVVQNRFYTHRETKEHTHTK